MPYIKEIYQNIREKEDAKVQSKPLVVDKFIQISPGQLAIIGSRPSMGKTAFLLYIIETILKQQSGNLLFISNEESEEQLFRKLACQLSSIPLSDIDGMMDEVMMTFRKTFQSERIILQHLDTPLEKQHEFILETIARKPVQFLFIDKLQGIRSSQPRLSRDRHLTSIVQNLKAMAKAHRMAVIAASSLKQSTEKRDGHYPMLSDLNGPVTLEEYSDMVMMLYRQDYYGITEDGMGNCLKGVVEALILKNRGGRCKNIKFSFNEAYPKFLPFRGYLNDTRPLSADRWYH